LAPSAFSSIITSIIVFAVGLSVLLKNRKRVINKWFFLYSLSLFFYFFSHGAILTSNYPNLSSLRLLTAISAGFAASWFFKIFLFGKTKNRRSRVYTLFTILLIFLFLLDFYFKYIIYDKLLPLAVVLHSLISAISVLSSIKTISSSTTSNFVKKRLQYLSISTAMFVSLLLTSQLALWGVVSLYIGHVATIIYIYFLGETILHHRFLNFNETIAKIGAVTGIVSLISLVYWILLFWLPVGGGEFLLLNIFVGSLIVVILIEPFEKIAAEWINLFFKGDKGLVEHLSILEKQLIFIRESEKSIGELVLKVIQDSGIFNIFAIYFMDDDKVTMRLTGGFGNVFPRSLPIASNKEFMEKLSFQPYLSKDETEQELDRLKRGWAISFGGESLEAAVNSLQQLNSDFAIPITTQNRLFGFISFDDSLGGSPFSEKDIDRLRSISKLIGSALTNTSSFKNAREQERLAVLGEMSAGLAHEIRNPLGAITGAAQLLTEDLTDNSANNNEMDQFLSIIVEESQRLNNVVKTFLEFSRSSEFSKGKVDLSLLLEKSIPIIKTTEPRLSISTDKDGLITPVKGNEDKLKQVIINLLMNSIQSIDDIETGIVKIKLSMGMFSHKKVVVLEITDNGSGIPKNIIHSVFKPFFTTSNGGTGLGLPICKKIIENHHGKIKILSDGEKGTTVTIMIPAFEDKKHSG
jgi:two-component system, NtrC family, sensor histidine kinase HydH